MRFLIASILLGAALVAGCGSPTTPPTAKAIALPVELKPVTVAQLNEFLADQKGKVILVDCWSLT